MTINYLDQRCIALIEEAVKDPNFDKAAFSQWMEQRKASSKKNPSAWFAVAFPSAKAEGRFSKHIEIELPDFDDEEPEPQEEKPTTPQEIADQEEADYQDHLALIRFWADKGIQMKWLEPNDPRFEQKPSIFDTAQYKDHDEYRRNTFISVYREARETGETMHEVCERKGLIYEALLM